jgi:hypothetical protein
MRARGEMDHNIRAGDKASPIDDLGEIRHAMERHAIRPLRKIGLPCRTRQGVPGVTQFSDHGTSNEPGRAGD